MNDAWQETRRLVIQRARGVCERCRTNRGRHVHHLRYWPNKSRGGEPLEWLELLCLTCHGLAHPHHTFRPIAEQRIIAARRAKKRRKPVCSHCGNTWSRERHRAICVRFGLDTPRPRRH